MLREIFTILRPFEICLLLTLSLGAMLTNLGLLGAAAWLISSAALMPPLYALTLGITAVRALGIGRAVLRYGERYFTHAKAFALVEKLRLHLYDTASHLASTPKNRAKQGTMLNALLTNGNIVQDFLLRGLLPPAVLFLGVVLLLLCLYPVLNIAALLLPFLYLLHLMPLCFPMNKKNRHSQAYRNQLLDFAQGSQELLMASSLSPACAKLDQSALNWQKKLLQSERQQDQIDLLLGIVRLLVFVSLFALLIDDVRQDMLDGIGLSLWVLILLAFFNELPQLPHAVRHFQEARLAAHSLQRPSTGKEATSDEKAALLTVKNLSFHYPHGADIFHQLNFSLTPGQHLAIIGDSGSGKTTLAYLLAGLWQPTGGAISYCPTDSAPICAIPQGSYLFSQSIRENFLRLHPAICENDILTALQAAQLTNLIKKLPQGIDTPLGENAYFLSGGERNRLITALILASPAPILLFDEPTAGLDLATAQKVLDNIIDRSNLTGQTAIVITHDLPQLHRFSQIMKMP
ncbi:ATP-binding cassette, subfamily C/ATP-binding cassette, subfamily C, CydC [Selenomonas ruminantium]|uniref:ATP-binding cassette, subfamily C/ATP-binding cassette, subfamily C, CydC n=1 Tax=Selenomonas ruminantium TaxID=971 RepID=A0A1M6SD30_SELRU|nr:ATP-binding cassette domain-containing protein [Selenomonas ruminantium]SHK42672.1 ATP-binding cassette, subfamily C/ATP-binding cassette, subfamily C, CydC [Selenomonas ruminantium]